MVVNCFVSQCGSGTHDGSSATNAMSWQEMLDRINGSGGTRYESKG